MKKYYVYLYLREDKYSPYYVGKGCDRRAYQYHCNVIVPPKELISIIYHTDDERDALDRETALIKFYGLKDFGGLLENKITAPGKGAANNKNAEGCKRTPEQKAHLAALMRIRRGNSTGVNKERTKGVGRGGSQRTPILIDGKEYVSVRGAARELGISKNVVWKRVHSSKFPKWHQR